MAGGRPIFGHPPVILLLIEQHGRLHAQAPRQRKQRLESGVALTPFDSPNVVSMKAGALSQLFLAELLLNTQAAHRAAESLQVLVYVHRAKVAARVKNLYTRSV